MSLKGMMRYSRQQCVSDICDMRGINMEYRRINH